ncbi:cytochrome c oxidase subunit II [Alkalibacillus almallahensis]|uniref:cytochrome c oxidase subunit II n=1 Tax=Alkalibacillus almallahensis TaxID=1379154 RepID=UPI00141EC27D|nr:cytochrome c oxidase subunit II [Alkalibacillus almallahensis]NIK12047.1 cytochrome c oxidase subunit 2 [Alkalibacillus almallahensis]
MHVHKLEKVWLAIGFITLVAFLTTVGIQAFASGHGAPSDLTKVDPQNLEETEPFDDPGLHEIGENEYELVMILQSYGFTPNEITIPEGATLHFKITSKDVVHGFEIAGTTVNMMATPGYVNSTTYTFDETGEYLILCNEYCGTGHHFMSAQLEVK